MQTTQHNFSHFFFFLHCFHLGPESSGPVVIYKLFFSFFLFLRSSDKSLSVSSVRARHLMPGVDYRMLWVFFACCVWLIRLDRWANVSRLGRESQPQHMHDRLTVKLELKLRRHIFHMCVVVAHAPAQIVGQSINQSSIIKSLLCCYFDALRHASVRKVALFSFFGL